MARRVGAGGPPPAAAPRMVSSRVASRPRTPSAVTRTTRSVLVALAVIAGVALLAGGPALLSRWQRPQEAFGSYAEAVRAGAIERGLLPQWIPRSATEIRTQRDAGAGRLWVRFRYDPADFDPVLARFEPVPEEERERVPVPQAGWNGWWLVGPETLESKNLRKAVQLHRTPRGYLAVYPRVHTAYYWVP